MSVPKYALVFQADRGPDKSGNIIVDDIQVTAGPCSGTVPPIVGDGDCKCYSTLLAKGKNMKNTYFLEGKKCADTRITVIHFQLLSIFHNIYISKLLMKVVMIRFWKLKKSRHQNNPMHVFQCDKVDYCKNK